MVYYKNNQWVFYSLIVYYRIYDTPEFKYTDDRKWWINFVNKWGHYEGLRFEKFEPTIKQKYRLIEINNLNIWEGYQSHINNYVENGILPRDKDNNILPLFNTLKEDKNKILKNAKNKILNQINDIKYTKIYKDSIEYIFPGDTIPDGIQMRNEIDRQNIQDFIISALIKKSNEIMFWKTSSNEIKKMTTDQVIEMGKMLTDRINKIMNYSWILKKQILKTNNINDLNKINIIDNWPL